MGYRRRLLAGIGVVAVFVMGATAFAAIPNDDGNIYGCYSNGDGSLRVQQDPAKPCPKNWSPLKWTAGQPHVPVTRTYVKLNQQRPSDQDVIHQFEVSCDDGDVATGGGFDTVPRPDTGEPAVKVYSSAPLVSSGIGPYGWRVTIKSDLVIETIVNTWVICQHTE